MAFIQKLFQAPKFRRQNTRRLSVGDSKNEWKKPQYEDKSIRLVLFLDNDTKGRRIIFDSKAVVSEEEKGSKWRCRPGQKLMSVKEGKIQGSTPVQRSHNYVPQRTGSDGKMLEELMFGAVGVAYKGTSLKVHVIRSPPQLMLTKVFMPDKPKRLSALDAEESFSSAPDLSIPRTASMDSSYHSLAQSVPVDVPSPKQSWMKSFDLIDEDSGLASLTSSGSFQAPFPSPSSTASSCNSLGRDRRLIRGQSKSLEVCGRRMSQDLLTNEMSSPNRHKRSKMALGIMFGTMDERNEEANRLFENFFFSHIALFEGRLEQLKLDVERAYYSGSASLFLTGMIDAFETFKRDICDLYTAPRLSEPIWLDMMSYSSYRYMLCEKFLFEFVSLVTKYDNKNTNFFMSTLVTSVLTHHLAWVPTVTPAGGTPSHTYLEKHSAKWVDTLAKSHPYNPLWAQLGDLYGAIGFPLKLSRTVIVGKKAELVKKILYVISYFIRCSDIMDTPDVGSLESCLKGAEFVETPGVEVTTTPVNSENTLRFSGSQSSLIGPPSYIPLKLDSLLSESSSDGPGQSQDFNSNHADLTKSDFAVRCDTCERNRNSETCQENVVGRSTFYCDPDPCICDKQSQPRDDENPDPGDASHAAKHGADVGAFTRKKRDKMKLDLSLEIPVNESLKPLQPSTISPSQSVEKECRLSVVNIVEDVGRDNVSHVRKCVELEKGLASDPMMLRGELSYTDLPSDKKVLSKEEIKNIFIKKGSDSMFNEYFEEGIETKTIDDIDEKDRVVDLPNLKKQRYLSGEGLPTTEDPAKAPSLPDLTSVKSDSIQSKTEKSHRSRLGSLDQNYTRRKSFSRQLSENTRLSKNAPGRCRPVTPTELGKRRHISSASSFEFDFLDPRAYCREMPMPNMEVPTSCETQKSYDRNFGRSLLADFSDHYMSDFVLHGTSDKNFQHKLERDLRMATQYSVLDEPISEAVCIVADTDQWSVRVYSSQHLETTPTPCVPSHLIANLVESLMSMWKLKMSPEFCIMHLEDRLQEIYFKSKMMSEYLKKDKKIADLLSMFEFNRSDLPLLAAIAGTHSPNFPLVCLS